MYSGLSDTGNIIWNSIELVRGIGFSPWIDGHLE